MLDGELAVPSRFNKTVPETRYSRVEFLLQGRGYLSLPKASSVDVWVRRGERLRTLSGPEGSSNKEILSGVVG